MGDNRQRTSQLEELLRVCKQKLSAHYEEQLQGVVLYGSAARGEASAESDVDLLVLLEKPVDYFEELEILIDLLFEPQLEFGVHISARPADTADFEAGIIQLYRNARQEGVRL
ncbi:MAG: nucleotidyltransferase domain-containing protein [Candidatus Hydrogenedentes bacterium]|nr:nucleotidyltransferase domain-containing protein [Candidatus Hydrogenedentota bacterium]